MRGPRVHAERVGTADAGGGQISVVDHQLMVQGPVRGRLLGPVSELHRMVFEDHRGRRMALHFVDGVTWTLSTEGDDLMPFALSLEQLVGRVDMIEKAPTPAQQLQAEMTPERKLMGLQFVGAIVIAVALYFAASTAAAVGYAIVVVALPYLMAAAAARVLQPPPQWMAGINNFTRARGWVLAYGAPAMMLVASAFGVLHAGQVAAVEAIAAREQASVAAANALAAEKQSAEEAKRTAAISELLTTIDKAVDGGRISEAQTMIKQAEAIAPESTALESLKQRLAPKLEAEAEAARQRAVREGLGLARRIIKDPLRCDSANSVSEAWRKIRQVRGDDEQYTPIAKLLPGLERCRRRVEKTFSRGAEEARVQQRLQLASTFENELRAGGHATTIEFDGSRRTEMTIRLDRVDDATAAAIVGSAQDGKDLLTRAAGLGIRRVLLLDERKVSRKYPLKPTSGKALGREVLKGFELDQPLALGATPAAAAAE